VMRRSTIIAVSGRAFPKSSTEQGRPRPKFATSRPASPRAATRCW
jgi:hypothetical protein